MECGASFGEMLDLVHNVSTFKCVVSIRTMPGFDQSFAHPVQSFAHPVIAKADCVYTQYRRCFFFL